MQIHFIKIVLIFVMLLKMCLSNTRQKRLLLFPETTPTRVQFIFGIGIPLDTDTESVTSGYVIKLEFFLPTRAEQFHPTQITPQKIGVLKRSLELNSTIYNEKSFKSEGNVNGKYINKKLLKYRWAIYNGFETMIEKMGHPGRPCLLRSICEVAETNFHHYGGLFGEVLHIVMTPSTSTDDMSYHPSNMYFYAEKMGKSGAPCDRVFKDCTESVLDKFSKIFLI